jgi:hypothetical protein
MTLTRLQKKNALSNIFQGRTSLAMPNTLFSETERIEGEGRWGDKERGRGGGGTAKEKGRKGQRWK